MKHLLLKASLLLLPLTLAACAGGPEHSPCPMDGHPPMHSMYMPGMGMPMPKPTGDADVDFVRGMIPHHQMAVDESEKYLAVGHDDEIRRLAGHIEQSQQREIAMMNEWLDKRGMAVDDSVDNDMKAMPPCDMPKPDGMHHHWRHDGQPRPMPIRNAPKDVRDPAQNNMRDPRAAAAPDLAD